MGLSKKMKIIIVSAIVFDFMICNALFILYGPWPNFRTFWITTSMTTMRHQYLAHLFYSDETINEVMANNIIIEVNEDTDVSLINKNIDSNKNYKDKYEEQILKKDKGNDLYKVINVSGSGYKGFLVAIYDPSKIKLAMAKTLSTGGQRLNVIAKDNKAVVAINASGFPDADGIGNAATPTGSVIANGKIVYSSPAYKPNGGVIGFDKDNNLVLTKDSISKALTKYNLRDAVEFGPFLIVNGTPSFIKGNGGWGIAPRTVIGQRKDGIILLLIIDGRQPGYSNGTDMVELTQIMINYKAINAANLDGGASSGLIINNKIANKPCAQSDNGLRRLPNAWIITK